MRVFSYLAGALASLAFVSGVSAQFPGELRGDVVDVLSGRPVAAAEARVLGASGLAGAAGPVAVTDASGSFRIRGLEAGAYTLRVTAIGYEPQVLDVRIEHGASATVRMSLVPHIAEIDGLDASVEAGPVGARSLTRADIERLPVVTVGDVVAVLPGVRVESRVRGGAQIPTIRGSSGDAVLVLVDGVPINDPLTGEADLSTLRASDISAVHVLPGGQSARFGARAEAGIVLIRTGGQEATTDGERARFGAAAGSLGEWGADARLGGALGVGRVEATAGARTMDGRFAFSVPEAAGGGAGVRENAHLSALDGALRWRSEWARTTLRVGVAADRMERGLPGRSFAPSPWAEQDLTRGRLFVSAGRSVGAAGEVGMDGYLVGHRAIHRDPDPPFGHPFDDRTDMSGGGVEVRGGLRVRAVTLGWGLAASQLRVSSTQLSDSVGTVARTDGGAWLSVGAPLGAGVVATAAARADRSGRPVAWHLSHDVGAAWTGPGVTVRVAHRSSFSPPTLGDQFFRDGVGVAPNPDLQAERVPSEWAVGAGLEQSIGRVQWGLDVEAYRGDIRGMIVWLPDFRFVWSPRNHDVRRRGGEVAMWLRDLRSGLDVRGHLARNRTTYDRPGLEDVQVVYRPVWSGGGTATWAGGPWKAALTNTFTGARYPVPNRVNELPGFWTTDVSLGRRWRVGGAALDVGIDITRMFDHEDTLVFAFPDPGRTARLTLRWGG